MVTVQEGRSSEMCLCTCETVNVCMYWVMLIKHGLFKINSTSLKLSTNKQTKLYKYSYMLG